MITFQQSETTAERRRWIIVLVDSADGVTGLTGQTGTVKISKNGADAVASTNSIVEIDSTDMPGQYYIELTAAELDTLGFISITKKTAGSLAFHDRAIVSYNDPYISAGGFSGGGVSQFTLNKKQIEAIAEQLWKYKLSNEKTAEDTVIEAAADQDMSEITNMSAKMDGMEMPVLDLTPVLDKIDSIEIPQPADYSKSFKTMQLALKNFAQLVLKNFAQLNTTQLTKAISDFNGRLQVANSDVTEALNLVQEFKTDMAQVAESAAALSSHIDEMSDMDKRFAKLGGDLQKQQLADLQSKLDDMRKQILLTLTNTKFDIIEEIKNESN